MTSSSNLVPPISTALVPYDPALPHVSLKAHLEASADKAVSHSREVGHNINEDILMKNDLCFIATDVEGLLSALACLRGNVLVESGSEAIMQGLGISSDWANRLERAIKNFVPTEEASLEDNLI